MRQIFTIGHSTRKTEEFIEILKEFGIEEIIDVRTIPKSGYNPQFNENAISKSLKSFGIKYIHMESLGGLRHTNKDSINLGWKNSSFRGFADYMQTREFAEGLDELIKISRTRKIAIMCAESVPWRCHRSLIADALSVRNIPVVHILGKGAFRGHEITSFAHVKGRKITYPNYINPSNNP